MPGFARLAISSKTPSAATNPKATARLRQCPRCFRIGRCLGEGQQGCQADVDTTNASSTSSPVGLGSIPQRRNSSRQQTTTCGLTRRPLQPYWRLPLRRTCSRPRHVQQYCAQWICLPLHTCQATTRANKRGGLVLGIYPIDQLGFSVVKASALAARASVQFSVQWAYSAAALNIRLCGVEPLSLTQGTTL
jgi:hypothetical protein